jgi:hypothetical protein
MSRRSMIGDSRASLRMRKDNCVLRGCKCLGATAIRVKFSRWEIEGGRKHYGREREEVKMDDS